MKEAHILLVEDNPGDIVFAKEAFEEAKIKNRISVVTDGKLALDLLNDSETLPDLILLDINLPKMNGLELLMIIKNDIRLKRIPVIMLSTSTSQADILCSYNNHANCFITKPDSITKFIEMVKMIEEFWINPVKLS